MTSPIHQFASKLTESKLFGRVVESLPTEVRDALEDLAANDKPTLIRSESLAEGETLRGVAVFLGEVRRAAALRGVNLMKGTITGGTVRGCNVGVVDLVDGDVRGVNLLIGNVRGGALRGINVLTGDVHGGSIEGANVLVGDLRGGVVKKTNLFIGDVRGGRLDVNVLLGNVYDGEVSAKIHVGEVRGGSVASDRSLLEGSAASIPAANTARPQTTTEAGFGRPDNDDEARR